MANETDVKDLAPDMNSEDDVATDMVLDEKGVENLKFSLKRLSASRERYLKSKKITEAMEKIAENNELSEDVCIKIKRVLDLPSISLDYYYNLDLDKAYKDMNVLGLSNDVLEMEDMRLTFFQIDLLDKKVIDQLRVWCSHFQTFQDILHHSGLGDFVDQPVAPETLLNDDQTEISRSRHQLCKKMERRHELMKEVAKLQSKNMNLILDASKKLNSKCLVLHKMTAREAKERIRTIQTSINSIICCGRAPDVELLDVEPLDGLREMIKQIDKESEECELELKRLKAKLAAYNQLDNTEFVDIVKQYGQRKNVIKQWKWTLDELTMSNEI